jgi:peroxiredoxin
VPPVEIKIDIEVGTKVGQRVPDFAIDLVDGTTVTAVDLIAEGQPTFLFFFATW